MADKKTDPTASELDAMQKELIALQLQEAHMRLEQTSETVRQYNEKKLQRSRDNARRQEDLKQGRNMASSIQKSCRHKSGGHHTNVLRGNGRPCVTRTLMLDNFTWRLSCLRCRLEVFTPHPSLETKEPKEFKRQMAIYQELWDLAEDSEMDPIKGPNFNFARKGIPFVPERKTAC